MLAQPEISVLLVCLGNICRSPLAEGVFRAVVDARGESSRYRIDSAGTGGWHAGSAPDPRSIAIASRYGIDISAQVCRQVRDSDFLDFDLILGMDSSNVADLIARAPIDRRDRIHLFMQLAHGKRTDVPDPYYGGADGFASVYRMIRDASERLASKLAERASATSSGQTSSTT